MTLFVTFLGHGYFILFLHTFDLKCAVFWQFFWPVYDYLNVLLVKPQCNSVWDVLSQLVIKLIKLVCNTNVKHLAQDQERKKDRQCITVITSINKGQKIVAGLI